MAIFYSMSTGNAYPPGFQDGMPGDAIEITKEIFLSVIANPPAGKVRGHDLDGVPILVDAPADDPGQSSRNWRDMEIKRVQWLRDRHRDELDIGLESTLTAEQFRQILVYIQALRDWPEASGFPADDSRPIAPGWIAELVR